MAFDMVNACAGFVYALDAASRYLQCRDVRKVLVIGVDRGSRLVDHHDRRTCVFFGDGAASIWARAEQAVFYRPRCIRRIIQAIIRARRRFDVDGWQGSLGLAIEPLPLTVWRLCELGGVKSTKSSCSCRTRRTATFSPQPLPHSGCRWTG